MIRIFGIGDKASGEPGYASETVNFLRGPRPAGLEPAAGLASVPPRGNTPMISRRVADFTNEKLGKKLGKMRFDLEGDSHIVTGRKRAGDFPGPRRTRAGAAFIHRNRDALPRVRLMGQPVYADDQPQAVAALERIGRGAPRPACGRRSHAPAAG